MPKYKYTPIKHSGFLRGNPEFTFAGTFHEGAQKALAVASALTLGLIPEDEYDEWDILFKTESKQPPKYTQVMENPTIDCYLVLRTEIDPREEAIEKAYG